MKTNLYKIVNSDPLYSNWGIDRWNATHFPFKQRQKLFLWYLLLMWYMKNSLQKYIPWNGKRVKPNSNKTSHKMDKTLKDIKIINSLLFSHEISRRWCIFTIKCAQKEESSVFAHELICTVWSCEIFFHVSFMSTHTHLWSKLFFLLLHGQNEIITIKKFQQQTPIRQIVQILSQP